jgi:ABC-type antimicrobial peptide transport system permease subunit
MFHLLYVARELRRRLGRTVLTALGLALGVGLVIGIIGVSQGLDNAQNEVLAPLQSIGTDILVTRVAGAQPVSTSSNATSTTSTTQADTRGRGGGFFAGRGPGGGGDNANLNVADATALLNENSNVVTDLSKLGPAGTKFTHDFFLSQTLLSFPQNAVSQIAKLPGVASATGGLVQRAEHQTGTVPQIVANIQTGGQTYTQTVRPAGMDAAERQAFQACLQARGVTIGPRGGGAGRGAGVPGGTTGTTVAPPAGGGGEGGGGGGFRDNPAFQDCLPQRFKEFNAQFTTPLQNIQQVVNPPSTDITNQPYTAAGIDPATPKVGLVTQDQLTSGRWLGKNAPNEVLINVAYANTKSLKLGSTIPINGADYTVVGLVNPTLTGSTADIYFPITTLQTLAGKDGRVTQVLVKANKAKSLAAVTAEIQKLVPGAEVVTSKALADQVTGNLADAHNLVKDFGGILAVIVLLAAFTIAVLLTLSSISKRVREIGTLRAIGWSKARILRQLLGETIGIGLLGGILGIAVGFAVAAGVHAVHPVLTATTAGVPGLGSASSLSTLFGSAGTAAHTTKVTLTAPLHLGTLALGVVFALIGGTLAGLIGGWRAARLAPAVALRDIG